MEKSINFWADLTETFTENSNGTINAYNRGLLTLDEAIATILDFKREADIKKAKRKREYAKTHNPKTIYFERMRTVNKIIEDAYKEALDDDPENDFYRYRIYIDKYGIDESETEIYERMLWIWGVGNGWFGTEECETVRDCGDTYIHFGFWL